MSVYDPYIGRYRTPSVWSYPSYVPTSSPYSTYAYTDDMYQPRDWSSSGYASSERIYYSYHGKLIKSYKIRNYKRAQRHVLNLFPDALDGVASSRIQFFVMRPGLSTSGYRAFKSYIAKSAWLAEMDSLAEHEALGVEVRPSISLSESISSFFNRRFI